MKKTYKIDMSFDSICHLKTKEGKLMTFKLLGINGSPKKPVEKSNTYHLLTIALESAQKQGAETTLINLNDYNIELCTGCELCTTKTCPLDTKDDYVEIEKLIIEHDAIIIASPSYWSAPPGILKNVMDRSRDNKMPEEKWKGKIFGAIAMAGLRVGGQLEVINSLINFALGHGMIIVGATGNPWFNAPFPMGSLMYDLEVEGKQKVKFRHVKHDPIATKDAELLGKRMTEIGVKLFS